MSLEQVPAQRSPIDIEALVHRTSCLLEAGVPLTLLLDLAEPAGPHSTAVYVAEGGTDITGGVCADIDWGADVLVDALDTNWTSGRCS